MTGPEQWTAAHKAAQERRAEHEAKRVRPADMPIAAVIYLIDRVSAVWRALPPRAGQ